MADLENYQHLPLQKAGWVWTRTLASVSILLAAFVTLAIYSGIRGELSLLPLFFLFLLGGLLATNVMVMGAPVSKAGAINTFVLAYSLSVIVTVILSTYYLEAYEREFLWNRHRLSVEEYPLVSYGMAFIRNIGVNGGVHDDLKFHIAGIAIARDWSLGTHDSNELLRKFSYLGYPWYVGITLYVAQFFGDMSPLAPRLLNSMFGGLMVVAVGILGSYIYGLEVGRRAALLSAVFPIFLFYSGNTFRDLVIASLVVMLCLAIYRAVIDRQARLSFRITAVVVTLVLGIALFLLRSATLYVVIGSMMGYFVIYGRGILQRMGMLCVLVGLAIVALNNLDQVSNQSLGSLLNKAQFADASRLGTGNTESLAIRFIYSAPTILLIPLGIIYMTFYPFPPIRSFDWPWLFEGLGTLWWYFLIPFWFYGLFAGLKNRDHAYLSVISLSLFITVAVVGGDIRHKTQFLPLSIIQVCYAQGVIRLNKALLRVFISILILVGLAVYASLKGFGE